jgi:hypothetical protein
MGWDISIHERATKEWLEEEKKQGDLNEGPFRKLGKRIWEGYPILTHADDYLPDNLKLDKTCFHPKKHIWKCKENTKRIGEALQYMKTELAESFSITVMNYEELEQVYNKLAFRKRIIDELEELYDVCVKNPDCLAAPSW